MSYNSTGHSHPDVTWQQVFKNLDRKGQALNIQIRRSLVLAIETGIIKKGDKLPSSRHLAGLVGVARNTVTAAYKLLIDDGFLISKDRSGIFVAADILPAPSRIISSRQKTNWPESFAVAPSQLRHLQKSRDWQQHSYPFLYGQFDPAIFPTNDWREAIRATSSVSEISHWAGDRIDDDDPELIEQLCVQVLPRRGIFAQRDEILITLGSQQALSMLVQLFGKAGSKIGFEDPGYPDIRNMVQMSPATEQALAVDKKGVIPNADFSACSVAFLTINKHCPTTVTMPAERRREVLRKAIAHDIVLIEDDYEADMMLDESVKPNSLKSLDQDGRIIYTGSFSKSLAPGLRIGYIVAAPDVIRELRVLRRLIMRHPPSNNQRILATFIALGHYTQHLERNGKILAQRAELIRNLLPQVMPDCAFEYEKGSMSFWIRLPENCDGQELQKAARNKGVLIEAGDIFFTSPEAGKRFIRLGFTSITGTHIETGLKTLGSLIPRTAH
ncbi:aminotransferase-like domain-containing protein [Kiloniella sp. b19]|uniref:aminotransferase-like domain-containing protein n=1 Tax=Kiloniella sp. GXU_MW_B19 TaxID=3141326 RepID=UPI0031D5F091